VGGEKTSRAQALIVGGLGNLQEEGESGTGEEASVFARKENLQRELRIIEATGDGN